jgi:hypothetical protein
MSAFVLWFGFWGTPVVDRHMKTFTRHARGFIDHTCNQYVDFRPMVSVWEGHRQSRAWLKRLGFQETGNAVWHGDNRFVLVERR